MRVLASVLFVLLGPATLMVQGRSELDILRARCTEQERQIRTLETEIESLHSQLALERRRSRGIEPSASPIALTTTTPVATCTVKAGDTLSSIARRYRTSADDLMKRNGIKDPTRLRVGQKLTLPAEATTPEPSQESAVKPAEIATASAPQPAEKAAPQPVPATPSAYKVQRGDTLYGIARKHKMSISDLKSLNPKVENKIIIGQSLAVSGTAKSPGVSLGSSKTQTITTRISTPTPKPTATKSVVTKSVVTKSVATKAAATKAPEKKSAPAEKSTAESKPASNPVVAAEAEKKEQPKADPEPKTISSIIVMDEISFGDFADKHGATPDQLNALNGWDFKSNLVLARGSEIYVPGR